jgi:hypothetical protein
MFINTTSSIEFLSKGKTVVEKIPEATFSVWNSTRILGVGHFKKRVLIVK